LFLYYFVSQFKSFYQKQPFFKKITMLITLLTIGKKNEPFVNEGIEMFTKRINFYYKAQWKTIAPTKNVANLNPAEQKTEEGKLLLNSLSPDDFLILLDERGKNIKSEQLANIITNQANQSTKNVIFAIGGAFGVSAEVTARANYIWSLSNLVFPHQIVRLILAEQVYRACTIIKNEKYHHT
jgi:23S rRNA (pseudouridine1915-N3)-methyltransferase